jgi:4-amino-4-deoxy-L-arabinose transferase-like glycosyltransferase
MSSTVTTKETAASTSWVKTAVYTLVGLALAAFIGYLIVYAIYAFALFRFPFDYDQGEGFELMDTLLFSRFEWPYRDNNAYPFYSSNYPPLFHVVIVPLVWLFGPQYWTGRLVSWLGTLITAAAIGYAVQRESKRTWLSLLSGLAFLASNYVYHVGPLFRQHMFMVMFETVAVLLLTVAISREEGDGRPRTRLLLGVMLLLLLAGYTKQLAYATVAATFIFLFLRYPLRAVRWAIPFAAVTGLVFLWINIATDGYWFLNTVTANINPFVPGQAEGLFRQWFRLHLVITVVAAAYALYELYFSRLSAYTVWFVVAVVNSVTAGKWGAGESYFATAIAASCILTGLAFHRLLQQGERKSVNWGLGITAVIALLFLYQAVLVFHMPTHTPLLANIARFMGYEPTVMIAPQTSCSAPRPPEPIPYVDSAGVSLLGRPPTAVDTAAGEQITAMILEGKHPRFQRRCRL